MDFAFMDAKNAWQELQNLRNNVYNNYSAMYSGNHDQLRNTGESGTFWNRNRTKSKMHVPLVADIAATSANLLFGNEPKTTVYHGDTELNEGKQQDRLEYIKRQNNFANMISEAGETCSALGDVYMVIRWNNTKFDYPIIDIVQADDAIPEYVLGEMSCLHCFTVATYDTEKDVYYRIYERYSRGELYMELYRGSSTDLGALRPESELNELGYQSITKCPIDEIPAVHIANLRPNRDFRWSMLGRSDFAGLRDLCDALDETYSSWIRDVRLAKAKLIVPVDYLRRKPQEMLDGVASSGSWEFDPDIETYVAMDIQTNDAGTGNYITPSQFNIRSTEHAATCTNLIESILQLAGYSPQTFGLQINGSATSGTALNIRERKSMATTAKKQTYWIAPLEHILTCLVRLDHVLYPSAGSDGMDRVVVRFSDTNGLDVNTLANTADMLYRAQSASTVTRVRMQHPDWEEQEITDEVQRIAREFAIQTDDTLTAFGIPMTNEDEPTE